MEIVNYPHPTLRHTSKDIKRVDEQLRQIVRRMFELMYEANGVGLAANQVNLPLRLFVVNLAADPEEGEEHVFINPVISLPKGSEEREEGCLSLPGVYGQVKRPRQVRVNAFTLDGQEVRAELTGLMARVAQHELDHLDGVLFTDRLDETSLLTVQPALDEFEARFKALQASGETPDQQQIADHITGWERKYC